MKILSRMLTRKPQPDETLGKIDLDEDLEPLRRKDEATADDSGTVNPTGNERAGQADARFLNPAGLAGDGDHIGGQAWIVLQERFLDQ